MARRRLIVTIVPLLMMGGAASAQITSAIFQVPAPSLNQTDEVRGSGTAPTPQSAVLTAQPVEALPATPETAPPATAAPDVAAIERDPSELECIAKVVVHEAGNQPRRGQLAVAQVIRERMKSGRFRSSACDVVKQRGQFFDVDSYHPSRTDGRWAIAMAVAHEALNDQGEAVAPGALFFHSGGVAMPSRIRVAQIADHTFYR